MNIDYIIFLPLIPALCAGLTIFIKKDSFVCLLNCLAALLMIFLISQLWNSSEKILLTEILPNINISLQQNFAGRIFLLTAIVLWFVNSLYSLSYLRLTKDKNFQKLYFWIALTISAVSLLALSANLLTMLIAYELITLLTIPLVAYYGDEKSVEKSRFYMRLLMITSLIGWLPAIAMIYLETGTLDIAFLPITISDTKLVIILLLIVFGTSKIALVPLHKWLTAAMVAPHPVSALLHAVAVVNAGGYVLIRVFSEVFGAENLLKISSVNNVICILSCFSLVFASVQAIRQESLKLRLAYSTIAQLALIPLALVLTDFGGAVFQLATHGSAKIILFMAAGAIYCKTGKKNIQDTTSIAYKMPITMALFLLASISLIGLPPFSGFVSKYSLLTAAANTKNWLAFSTVLLSSVLTAIYLIQVLLVAYQKPVLKRGEIYKADEAPKAMLMAMFIAISFNFLIFIWKLYF